MSAFDFIISYYNFCFYFFFKDLKSNLRLYISEFYDIYIFFFFLFHFLLGGNQAEFNDGELLRPFTDLCPPFAQALKSQKQPMECWSSSKARNNPWSVRVPLRGK